MIKITDIAPVQIMQTDGSIAAEEFATIAFYHDGQQEAQIKMRLSDLPEGVSAEDGQNELELVRKS
ncbi:MAG TPA: hypothetical protein VF747_06715 [Blastocatellia bacterium]|jgi:hypothetical protein